MSMWNSVELREIRVFLVLCEELHFGRAAERLSISQTRVSQIINEIETKLGVRVFERTSRRVATTPIGDQLREAVAPHLDGLRHALREVSESGQIVTGVLRLGLLFPSSGGPALMEIVRLFETRHPACRIAISEVGLDDPMGPLSRCEIDIMAARLPIDQPGITVGPVLARDERVLAVSVNHPLARHDSIVVEDLAEHQAHDMGGKVPQEYLDDRHPPRTPSGRPIRRRHLSNPTASELLLLVARGEIVHVTGASLREYVTQPGITLVPIRDMPPSRAGLVWRTATETAAIRAFAQAVVDTFRGAEPPVSMLSRRRD